MSKVYKWSFYDVENDREWLGDLHLSIPLPQVGETIKLSNKVYEILVLNGGPAPDITHCDVKKV
ncbi:hypothetical protein [Sutcliffiella deserti]|uniref:hypothetical protein n=1 Tax=Sutcliffiella deserti TaxID=2875501 RepID=UPI001CC0626B|nr:hypothetical protein [Sutcliffiella deserti]